MCSLVFLSVIVVSLLSCYDANAASLAAFDSGSRFIPGEIAPSNQTVCFQFAIKHEPSQLRTLEDKLWAVSDPDGADYGHYYSNAQLIDLISPPQQHIDIITSWLYSRLHSCNSSYTDETWVHLTKHQDMIHVCSAVEVATHIFQTTFIYYQHRKLNTSAIRASHPIVIPQEVTQVLDFIGSVNTPIHQYSTRSQKLIENYDIRYDPTHTEHIMRAPVAEPYIVNMTGGNKEISVVFRARCQDGSFHSISQHTQLCNHAPPMIMSFSLTLTDAFDRHIIHVVLTDACVVGNSYCETAVPVRNFDKYHVRITTHFEDHTQASSQPKGPVYASDFATPDFLRDLYGVPRGLRVQHPNNSQCVTEFLEQYYSQDDLDTYMDLMGLARENVTETIGYNDPQQGKITGGESQLDLQVMIGMAPGARTVFWSNPGRESANQQMKEEPFLRWLTDLQDTDHPPLVHSVSYGDTEEWLSVEYTDRLNIEFMKLGVRGITVIFAAGDTGIASEYDFDDPEACRVSHPEFPASSPYVLSVGATQLSNHNSPICNQVWRGIDIGCTTPREVVCEGPKGGVITSGGGFSRRYARPRYQEKLVQHYLQQSGVKMPPQGFFNASGRGYPDISAYGTKYVVIMDGDLVPTAGTSASTPTIAALVTLWNDIRLINNMPPLGFVNPLLYSLAERHPEAFNDVVVGSNACFVKDTPCCPHGFNAIAGWDAASGIGSPRFMELASLMRDRSRRLSYLSAPHEPHPYPSPNSPHIIPLHHNPMLSAWHIAWLDVAAVTTILGLIFIVILYIRRCTAIKIGEQQPLLSR